MKKNFYFYVFLFFAILPWLIQYFFVYPNGFLESQFELNLSHFWEKVRHLEPNFSYGQNLFDYSWISYFIPVTIFGFIFGKTYGIIHIAILVFLGFLGCYKLVYNYFGKDIEKNKELISSLVAFVFITSPTIFLYIRSTIGLTAPAMIFPLQLWLLFVIIENKRKILSIFLLFVSFFFILHTNITVILLNIGFLILISWIFFKKKYLQIFGIVFMASLPVIFWSVMIVFINLKLGYTPNGGIIESMKEDFYSNQTSIFHILKQTADWGFFGGSHMGLYYDFSVFYKNNFIEIIGISFAIIMLLFIAFSKEKRVKIFFILILFIIIFMLGNKFFIYDYLYKNFTPFQIFRNIQKFAPFLLLLLLFTFIYSFNKKNIFIYLVLFLGVIYNIPYFYYSNFFVKERIVSDISDDWKKTISFINENIKKDSKILSVPSVYVNEVYNFKSGKYLVGIMTDKFTDLQGYRLSPILNGDYFMQMEMKKLFISSNSTLNGQKFDTEEIYDFLKKFHIPYILVTMDVMQNYEKAEEYLEIFNKNKDYKLLYSNNSHFIYENTNINKNVFIFDNIKFEKHKFGKYSLELNIFSIENLDFLQSFHPGWKLYLEPYSEISCQNPQVCTGTISDHFSQSYIVQSADTFAKISEKFENNFSVQDLQKLNPRIRDEDLKIGQEINIPSTYLSEYSVTECTTENKIDFLNGLKKLSQKPIFEDSHKIVYDYANQWTLDAEYIKNNFPKEYYKENEDGSIDIKLTLYFKPQSYFYLGLLISGITFIILLSYLTFAFVREKRKK